ncbi:hypothetical protein S245_039335 [Arachis hypogaea]|nr:uncharacterized protein LOC112726692 [Arachis hypogaea]QHO22756.1 uncharacterized protein DS421_12g357890 [Arachis hypogaea]
MCFKSRMSCISSQEAARAEISGGNRDALSGNKPSLFCRGVRRRPVVAWLPVIPAEELNFEFAIVNDMEEWLVKVCHEARISGPCFFKQERFMKDDGPFFGFNVVIPGDPFDGELFAKGRFSLEEKAARKDAAFEMLGLVLDVTKKEIRDYNYAKVKRFRDANNPLRARVSQLEEDYEKLKASYGAVVSAHIAGESG